MLYKSGNKPTAICSFKHILCKFANAINELAHISESVRLSPSRHNKKVLS
jgi:hypothetical protein